MSRGPSALLAVDDVLTTNGTMQSIDLHDPVELYATSSLSHDSSTPLSEPSTDTMCGLVQIGSPSSLFEELRPCSTWRKSSRSCWCGSARACLAELLARFEKYASLHCCFSMEMSTRTDQFGFAVDETSNLRFPGLLLESPPDRRRVPRICSDRSTRGRLWSGSFRTQYLGLQISSVSFSFSCLRDGTVMAHPWSFIPSAHVR